MGHHCAVTPFYRLLWIGPSLAGRHVKGPTCRRVRRPLRSPRCHEPEIPAGSRDRWAQSQRHSLPTMCNLPELCGKGGVSVGVWLPKMKGSFVCQQNYTKLYLQRERKKKTWISLKLSRRMRRGRKGKPSSFLAWWRS